MAKKTTKKQKMTAQQRREREKRALQRKQEQEAKQAKSNLIKACLYYCGLCNPGHCVVVADNGAYGPWRCFVSKQSCEMWLTSFTVFAIEL